jgi:4-hydroxymandelate oxidase
VEAVNLRGMPQPQQTGDLMSDHILFGTPLATGAPRWSDLEWLRAHPAAADRQRHSVATRSTPGRGAGGRCHRGLQPRRTRIGCGRLPIEVLADVRQAVGPQLPLLLDSGIRQGTDVLKAWHWAPMPC